MRFGKTRIRQLLAWVALGGMSLTPALAAAEPIESEPFRSPRTEARLVAEHGSVRPDDPFRLGLVMHLAEGWHAYWKNPGDSGTAPVIEWSLPAGWTAGPIAWPYPERFPVGPFVNFGYEGEILLPVRVTPPADAGARAGRALAVEAEARWLVCKEDCIPESATFSLELPVDPAPPTTTRWSELFARMDERMPLDLPEVQAKLLPAESERLRVDVTVPPELALEEADLEFFPATPAAVEHAAEARIEAAPGRVRLTLARSPFAPAGVTALEGVLVAHPRDARDEPTVAFRLYAEAESAAALPARQADLGLGAAAGLAFLGGLLLNLMPCVFPVISIKILSLLGEGGSRGGGRRHGLLFAAGVLCSFWILAGVLLALRAAGRSVGWGFQLQSPMLLGLLSLLFFAIGLNFLGVFELGSTLGGRAGSVARRGGGHLGAFLNGMLATLVATPCTAPFMGTAIGFAVVVEPAVAVLVFTALGLGMAAPYVALVLVPRALAWLPRPGRWMETLKQFMAFPMFATVIWLLWVLSAQTGSEGILAAMIALLMVAFAAWTAGRIGAGVSSKWRVPARAVVVLLAASAVWAVVPQDQRDPARELVAAEAPRPDAQGLTWIPWSPETVERLRAEGRPTYVDFTARWCLTCQVNKKVVFGSDEVRRALVERDVALVRADWTSRDPRITDALIAFGRSGVPLNVYYPPGAGAEPRVLPSVLSPGIVLEALDTEATR
jgi:thiol:disulfide interchange protein DsbD